MQFHVPFSNVSVISERRAGDNERLCALEPRLRYDYEHVTANSVSHLTYWATDALKQNDE